MKIVATCDIHYDLLEPDTRHLQFLGFLKDLKKEAADVLILAGDTVGLGWAKLSECLESFGPVAPVRLMVFGNHDYWSADKNTFAHLRKLQGIITGSGFHLLDRTPLKVDGIGFAGNCGWYDYTFGVDQGLGDTSFEKKIFKGQRTWNDVHFVDLKISDPEYTDELIDKLEHDIRDLEAEVDTIVAVTHHLGFRDMLTEKPEDQLWTFANAFMGSEKLGQMLLKHSKVKYHICGHSHHPCRLKKKHLEIINPGSNYNYKRYTSLEIE